MIRTKISAFAAAAVLIGVSAVPVFAANSYSQNYALIDEANLFDAAGSEQLCAGEEEVLLTDITRKGLLVRILPEDICYTEPATTGNRAFDDKMLRSKGAVYAYSHSLIWAFFRSWREALSLAVRSRRSPFPIFRNIWSGVKYIRS